MKKGIKSIDAIRIYLLVNALLLLIGTLVVLIFDKTQIHLKMNQYHAPFWDSVFPYVTHLGDGLTGIVVVLLIVIFSKKPWKYQYLTLGGMTLLFSGITAQLLKHLVYPDAYRPVKFIGQELLHLIPDVEMHAHNSFPSGHSSTAFALFTFLLFISRRHHWAIQIFVALFTFFVAYSRIYLSQHFLEDVLTGAVIGILSYVLAHVLFSLMPFRQNLVML